MIKDRFLELLNRYSEDLSYNLKCWDQLFKNYNHRSRHYHNIKHLEDMLLLLPEVEQHIENKDAILFSIFYHDIIYKVTRKNNEYKSAQIFREHIAPTKFKYVDNSFDQILATKHHEWSEHNDTNILLDLDLHVLGKSPEDYETYTENIRKEYSIYPNFLYQKGRIQVLKSFLDKEQLFKTPHFKEKYEFQAKTNLKAELKKLSK
ncbi:hypothetical protein CJ305_01485 [Leeuwenhoekiella nanhaiensis]|uniref:Metal-dependent HD superfamily phosphohydrolase n=2 Tax=Leeuwenhoekiella nanhaiensis TaxID=1655491 RepID=A0A2G1VVW7_9FLAO|nr:hypothetical protein CJ305_01485 [Leeuwenhoekiella nanhaiensis]